MCPEDKKALQDGVELFRNVYCKEISEQTFERKHFLNPNRLEKLYIIEYKNEHPVAMRWMMHEKMLCGDVSLSSVQSSDDAVLPEARGLLFLKIRKKSISMMEAQKVDFEYGCFAQGDAMEIAEKLGEKNVVNLYLARLHLHEKTHRWKRFDIPYPPFISDLLMKQRKRHLKAMSSNKVSIDITDKVTFSDSDYKLMNDDNSLHIERNDAYYQWKTNNKEGMSFITARDNGTLQGFIIIQDEGKYATIIDWDIFHDQKEHVLAAMMLPICEKYQYIDIPSLNVSSGEMQLFTDIGCKDMSRLWAPICICVKPINEEATEIIMKAEKWKHRLIDADYFMNK